MEEKKTSKMAAATNLVALQQNSYPGRGIIVGMDETGEYLVQVYWIMGRSENSRNRVFVIEDYGVLKTAPFDPNKVKDPSLIIYTAMAQTHAHYAVSNGAQTLDILELATAQENPGLSLQRWQSLEGWQYEPDPPNYTPRISGLISPRAYGPQIAQLSILRKSPDTERCQRHFFAVCLEPGLGFCVTTYRGDGDPLPSFDGPPYLLPLSGGMEEIAQTFWDSLNRDNRVSVAVKFIGVNSNLTLMTMRNAHGGD